jgi:hypothetical protein
MGKILKNYSNFKPKPHLKANLGAIFIGWSFTKYVFLCVDRKFKIAARAHNVF